MSESSCCSGWFFVSMRYWMFGRSKLATKCFAEPRSSLVAISLWVTSVAVAVSAMRGTVG